MREVGGQLFVAVPISRRVLAHGEHGAQGAEARRVGMSEVVMQTYRSRLRGARRKPDASALRLIGRLLRLAPA